MVYSNKQAQKEANKEANKRYREKLKGITKGITVVSGNEIPGVIPDHGTEYIVNDSGARLPMRMLVESDWRELLTYLVQHMNPEHMESLRVGIGGMNIAEVKPLLECTA